jgi:hypothetical protein
MRRAILKLTAILVGLSIFGLVGCGGGGGGEPPAADQPFPAEGFWVGTINNDSDVLGVVLENGQYWFFYDSEEGYYVLQGNATASNGSFSSTDARQFEFVDGDLSGVPIAFNVSASYRERSSLQGTATRATDHVSSNFALTYEALYDTAATASAVSGRWLLDDDVNEFEVVVDDGGTFSGTPSTDCQVRGSIVPRRSGKAVYDFEVTFTGERCRLGEQTMRGIAIMGENDYQEPALFAVALNSQRNAGFRVFGERPPAP